MNFVFVWLLHLCRFICIKTELKKVRREKRICSIISIWHKTATPVKAQKHQHLFSVPHHVPLTFVCIHVEGHCQLFEGCANLCVLPLKSWNSQSVFIFNHQCKVHLPQVAKFTQHKRSKDTTCHFTANSITHNKKHHAQSLSLSYLLSVLQSYTNTKELYCLYHLVLYSAS